MRAVNWASVSVVPGSHEVLNNYVRGVVSGFPSPARAQVVCGQDTFVNLPAL